MPDSARSIGSSSSLGRSAYRMVNRTADVDETLFGAAKTSARGANGDMKEVIVTGKDTVRVRNKIQNKGNAKDGRSDCVIIPALELDRLRDNATLISKEQEYEMKKRAEDAYNERMQKSQERKEKMVQMEKERKKNELLSERNQEGLAQKNSVLEKAKRMLDEEMDDVKHMNKMMLYSKIVTIRDAQIEEKRLVQKERQEEEERLDQMMEIERLKRLDMYEQREKMRLEDSRRGAAVIVDQIKERQAQRMRDEEARDMERAAVLKDIEALKVSEAEQIELKRQAAERLMEEVNEVNAAALKIKSDRVIAEKTEEAKIIAYLEAKDQRDREFEEEKMRLAGEKELETAKLRARQEKAQDKAAEMDALRARRATEAEERTARKKEKLEKERLETIMHELNEARQQQQADKEKRVTDEAIRERELFEGIIDVQKRDEEAEKQRKGQEKALRKQHCDELRQQISARQEKNLQARRDFLEAGNGLRAEVEFEHRKLEAVKARKIEELTKAGVPEKYRAELTRKKISV